MLTVKTPDEVLALIETAFSPLGRPPELVPLSQSLGRVLAEEIRAAEYLPDFSRSTVDGYALRAADTFGCGDALPAILTKAGEIRMGEAPGLTVESGTCAVIPTGGALPPGADAVQMLEYVEDYGDGTVGILKSAAPGHNLIFRGDDVTPGKPVLPRGRRLEPQDIGALAALGVVRVPAVPRIRAGILSTGDELVPPEQSPGPGQVRDVNSALVAACLTHGGAEVRQYGIVPDDEGRLRAELSRAAAECDLVVVSGGSSAGEKDATRRSLEALGEVLFHGVAMKPGKPTLLGRLGGVPAAGLPGHPAAALFVTQIMLLPLVARLEGRTRRRRQTTARLTESVEANHGRAQYTGVFLKEQDGGTLAVPVRGKSGLITLLAGTDGFFRIPAAREGVPAGEEISVTAFGAD